MRKIIPALLAVICLLVMAVTADSSAGTGSDISKVDVFVSVRNVSESESVQVVMTPFTPTAPQAKSERITVAPLSSDAFELSFDEPGIYKYSVTGAKKEYETEVYVTTTENGLSASVICMVGGTSVKEQELLFNEKESNGSNTSAYEPNGVSLVLPGQTDTEEAASSGNAGTGDRSMAWGAVAILLTVLIVLTAMLRKPLKNK